ncbi:unnamed protein product [Linum trigynum]|uniref:YTH domain-containing family protein n=1 Tax=Linum trigynum TaxID=586398 RepID=A0AAV2CUH1_9ROSI
MLERNIVLENKDNRPVTFSRDTHEIRLKQGLEMLTIFKTYVPKASLLDDFNFYEDREKALYTKKNKPATLRVEVYEKDEEDDFINHTRAAQQKKFEDPYSLIKQTKNLSLNGYHSKKSSATNTTDGPVPAAAAP